MKLVIVDRRIGITPLSVREPEEAAIEFHASPLLDAMALLFEALWERAQPLNANQARSRSEASGTALTVIDTRILQLMMAGFKDQAIAPQLGLGLATVERRIRRMMQLLGAQSRFQFAHSAGRRGWLP